MSVTIEKVTQLVELRAAVIRAAKNSVTAINDLLMSHTPIEVLAHIKFCEIGFHPSDDRRLNLIEQVNQTFTYLVSFAAVEEILHRHPNSLPILLNLGTSAGSDLESKAEGVVAEVFAAVKRDNNRKLVKDVAKVASAEIVEVEICYRYVFFYSPEEKCTPFRLDDRFPTVEIVPLSKLQVWGDL